MGYDGQIVETEISYAKSLPSFQIVGLPNSSIQESKERVKSALISVGFKFPSLKITINLSPSDIAKDGTHFDLPIALLIALSGEEESLEDLFVFGELGLDGSIKESSKIFSLILSLAKQGAIKKVLVPSSLLQRLSIIPSLEVFSCDHLQDAIAYFKDGKPLKHHETNKLPFPTCTVGESEYYYETNYPLDFAEVKGQEIAKRASLISACGFHNLVLEGSPGCGKSMIAKRMQYVLPPLSLQEILDKVKLLSLDDSQIDISATRTFRSPHNSSTASSIFGGGSKNAKVGEIALANSGILFFDELPHFPKTILESLREPLEDYQVLISRVNYKVQYDANFLFIGAMNPCPCGNLLSTTKECRCNELEIQRYKNRLSEPFLDRMDLYVQMQNISASDASSISSDEIHQTVLRVFKTQKQRGQRTFNAKLNDKEIETFCALESEANDTLEKAVQAFALTFRGIKKTLKVARTIADINDHNQIKHSDILEALSFRYRT